ncbi:MAG: hypothetical protein C0405_11850 [Desulfovibrio sp.]|nr:hypothetical protein [Desulfovibrio sp.]
MMSAGSCFLRAALGPAPLLAFLLLAEVFSLPGRAQAASGDCPALFELYRGCHGRGQQADSRVSCLEASLEAMARALARAARKNPQGAQVLVEQVCGTGCEDALSGLEPATRQEFLEAFCE